jgi:hypothetical protein
MGSEFSPLRSRRGDTRCGTKNTKEWGQISERNVITASSICENSNLEQGQATRWRVPFSTPGHPMAYAKCFGLR